MPLGLCSLAVSLEAAGFTPEILDLCFSRHPEHDIRRRIADWQPWAIGLSIRNLDSGDFLATRRYLPQATRFARACRETTSAPMILGGPAVSISPQRMLERLNAEYAVVGDGEESFVELLNRLKDGREPTGIPGVVSRSASIPARILPAHVCDLQSLGLPQLDRWIDVRRYVRQGGHVPVQTKRGCGFRCTYCTYRVIEGARYRLRAPEAVADEIEQAVKDWHARQFEFVDSTFNHPSSHALEVCEAIRTCALRIELHTTALNPAATSRELLIAMRQAGFRSVVCSPDSASDEMLIRYRRGFTSQHIEQTAVWAREAGISVLWAFLFGGPGETEQTVKETLAFIERVFTPGDRILCTVGLRIYPDTELAVLAQQEGIVTADTDLSEPVFYFSPQIAHHRVIELLDRSIRRPQMIYLGSLQNSLVNMAVRAHSALSLPWPSWAAVPVYNTVQRLLRRTARHRSG